MYEVRTTNCTFRLCIREANETFQGVFFSEISIVNFCPFQLKISMVRKCCTQAVHPHNLSHILYRFLKARFGLVPEALPLGNVPSI